MYVASIFGYNDYIEINAFLTGSFSIGIISGAYSTEVFRGAVQSIHKGQFEASEVLGLRKKIYYYLIFLVGFGLPFDVLLRIQYYSYFYDFGRKCGVKGLEAEFTTFC